MPAPEAAKSKSQITNHTILEVGWYSGSEQLDIVKILASPASSIPLGIQTIEVRKGGEGFVHYEPSLVSLASDLKSFVLKYEDGGRWVMDGVEGEDAGGDRGIASYTLGINGEWSCSWQASVDAKLSARPKCSWVGEKAARLVQACFRTLRDPNFRKAVLERDKCCVITHETNPAVLEAAHVLGVGEQGSDQASNGLVLRRDLHALFDAHILRLNDDGVFSMQLALESYKEMFLEERKLKAETLFILKTNIEKRNELIAEKDSVAS